MKPVDIPPPPDARTRYKVLTSEWKSPFRDAKYKPNQTYECEDFCENREIDCAPGLYATSPAGLVYSFRQHRIVVECRCWGECVKFDETKERNQYLHITRELSEPEIRKLAKKHEPVCKFLLEEALFPIHPLKIKAKPLTERHKQLLRQWDSVWESVWDSVGDSVGDSVWASVWDSVWASVWASVGASVWNSVWASVGYSVRDSVWALVNDSVWESVWNSMGAYIGSLFPNIEKWKYIEHAPGEYPFACAAELWRDGYVPSYYGKIWRLHAGPKAKVVYTWKKEENETRG